PITDKVIISDMPQRKSRIHALLTKALGKRHGEKLRHTQSEVWSVPQSRLGRLVQKLRGFGYKVTHLRQDSNHILRRHKGPIVMSAMQGKMLSRPRASRETVAVQMMKSPEAAVAEYALTGGASNPVPAGNTQPADAVSRIVIPINETQHVTVKR